MIPAINIYLGVLDTVNKDSNGELNAELFNRFSIRGELRLMDWLTGNFANENPPEAISKQKKKDWLTPFLKKYKASLVDGAIEKPEDYNSYNNMYALTLDANGCEEEVDCDEPELSQEIKNHVITLLDGDRFNKRKNTFIKTLKPTVEKGIAKEIGNTFEIYPPEMPGVVLEYTATPIFGEIAETLDPTFNTPVVDETASTNYQWNIGATEALIYFIADAFFNRTSQQSGKAMSNASNQAAVGK